jgi:hypothetical protein
MGMLMFQHMEFFFLLLLVPVTGYCLKASTSDSFLSLLAVWFLYCVAQIDALWDHPSQMAFIHAGVYFVILGGLHNGIGVRMQVILSAMTFLDLVWFIFSYNIFPQNALDFPANIFYWQSLINGLFAYMCWTVIQGCRSSLTIAKYKRGMNGGFMARTSQKASGGV